MLKTIIFLLIAIALSVFAAMQFAAQLEAVSARKARRDVDNPKRSLELGKSGRAVFAGIFFLVMFVLSLLSKFSLISTILALGISVAMVLANTYFKSLGINALTTFFLLWVGNLISSIKEAGFTTSTTGWGKVYVVLQVIALILILVGTIAGNVMAFVRKTKRENVEAEELEEAVDESDTDETDEEPDDDDDEDDEDESPFEEDPFHEVFWNKAIKVGFVALIVVAAFVIGYWLEVKFDFFPPYIS